MMAPCCSAYRRSPGNPSETSMFYLLLECLAHFTFAHVLQQTLHVTALALIAPSGAGSGRVASWPGPQAASKAFSRACWHGALARGMLECNPPPRFAASPVVGKYRVISQLQAWKGRTATTTHLVCMFELLGLECRLLGIWGAF